MGVVDRTDEFRQIMQGLVAKGEYTLDNVDSSNQPSQMNVWSGEIGAEIHQAGLKVQELRKMAKKKDIFNDRTSDIQELTCRVKDDIQGLDRKIAALEQRVNGQGPNRSVQAHSKNVVETLKTRLLEVTKDFKDALETRTKTMEKQQERRSGYTRTPAGADPFSQRRQATPGGNPDDPESGMPAMSQTQLYHNSRAQAVESVQRTIGELATMFQKMAVMVTAQEEMIQRIDHDVDDTLDNMNNAQDNLLKYFHHISSNRALIIKVFMILLFFVVFFIIFLA